MLNARTLLLGGLALAFVAAGCAGKTKTESTLPKPQAEAPPPVQTETPAPAPEKAAEPSVAIVPIHFDFDKTDIHPDDRPVLDAVAEELMKHADRTVLVAGHCDERGTVEYNIALGDRRAAAARDYLVRLGASAERIRTISYGEAKPIDPGHDEAAWAKNRRDEFELSSARAQK